MGYSDSQRIKVYFDVLGGQYIDKATASYLGLNIDSEYYKLSSYELDKLVDNFDIEYELIQKVDNSIDEKKPKEAITLYVDEDNSVYIDKDFATALGIKTDINYVELGLGTVGIAKKYFDVTFRDLYTKKELPKDAINSVESQNEK